jgi:hypothetical protein
VAVELPAALACGEAFTARVTIENTGTATWTRAELVFGGAHVFEIAFTAPTTEGTYATDWRMVHELVRWFGETTAQEVVVDCPDRPRRTGVVRVEGNALADDQGQFHALGATMMWGLWGYKNDRDRVEQHFAYLADHGFDYVRVLGVVGNPNAPDYWDGREAVFAWPDYAEMIRGFTDLAYDTYGLRVEWTLIGDGQVAVPTTAEKYALVDAFLALAAEDRAHKIMLFEIANESWQNGFSGDEGRALLRELSSYMKDRTDVLVAASAPEGQTCEDMLALYEGGVADVATIHFDRDVSKVDGHWRPVRQPWGYEGECDVGIVGNNNEPIGPGSSVASEDDPLTLVAAAMATYVANIPFYVFHSRAGIRGDDDVWNMPGVDAFTKVKELVANDATNWSRQNHHWAGHPFVVYGGDPGGNLVANATWSDFGSAATSGVVRAYAGTSGGRFWMLPIGIKDFVEVEAKAAMDFDVLHPITGETLAHHALEAGERARLTGATALVVRGSWR